MNNWLGLLYSYSFILLLLSIAFYVDKRKWLSKEANRKLLHIGLSHWILIAMSMFDSPIYVALPPLTFIIINYLAIKNKWFEIIDRNDQSLGIVWYAVSLFVVSVLGILFQQQAIAIMSILILGYADGFGALIGIQFGKHRILGKSIEGSLTVFVTSFLVIMVCNFVMNQQFNWDMALMIALVVMIVELISYHGTDNLTIPITSYLMIYLIERQWLDMPLFIILMVSGLILLIAYIKKSITIDGAVIAMLVAFVLYQYGSLYVYLSLITFFLIGSIISKIGKHKKIIEEKIHLRKGPRNAIQVVANSLPAVIFVMIGLTTANPLYNAVAVMTFAIAMADTVSSEIGMLSKQQPFSITTFKKINSGLSGGITILGLVGGAIGAVIISLFNLSYGLHMVIVTIGIGFLGTIIDSVLGSLFQAKYLSFDGKYLIEQPIYQGKPLKLVRGNRFINNDIVNILSIVITSLLGLLIV